MDSFYEIEHEGIVKEVDAGKVKVGIVSHSACGSCHAKTACSLSDKKEKIIEIDDATGRFEKGNHVKIAIKKNQGLKAVFWAYILPFIIFLITLFTGAYLLNNELIAGGVALLAMVPYYIALYFFKKYFGKSLLMHIYKTK
jgi:sigma-E factor negative regulatory protein RseC